MLILATPYSLSRGKAKKDKWTRRVDITEQPADCLVGIEFTVGLSYPEELDPQIRHAVSAWVKFGGIGARTRRGCGSLELVEERPVPTESQRRYASLITLAPVTCLIGESGLNSVVAWKEAVELYREFRQGKDFARDPGSDPSKPLKLGRSRYPEADTIRALFPQERWTHRVKHPVRGFPRADLGLPIVFHFQEEGPDEDLTLESASCFGSRFASPVITKVIKVEGGYAPAIILLDAPHAWDAGDLVLKLGRKEIEVSKEQVQLSPEQHQQVSPLKEAKGLPIRDALLEYAKSKGFKEVKL